MDIRRRRDSSQRGTYRNPSWLLLEGTNCGALVEIERKILIEEHGNIARTGFHLSRSPSGQGGLDRAAAFFKLCHNGIVASDFTQPRGAYFEVWRHFVAK